MHTEKDSAVFYVVKFLPLRQGQLMEDSPNLRLDEQTQKTSVLATYF